MRLTKLALGPLGTNCYIVSEGSAAVIDPGAEPEKILEELDKLAVPTTHIIYTHSHWDHVGAGLKIKQHTGAEVIMGEYELDTYRDKNANLKNYLDMAGEPADPDRLVREGDEVDLNGLRIKVLFTPGHTCGSISLYSDGIVFTGDAVFLGSIGRTDLPGGNLNELISSVKNKILTLDDWVKIYPGHGPATSVGRERANNPYLAAE